jgi:hypothetical protein
MLKVDGEQTLSFLLNNISYHHIFLVSHLQSSVAGNVGTDFLKPRQAILDLDTSYI